MSLGNIVQSAARSVASNSSKEPVGPLEFIESSWGLNMKLYPVQRVIIKAHYGIALDPNVKFIVTDHRRENQREMSEPEYLEYLFTQGRSNIKEVIPGRQRRRMVLSLGRRSGKTSISACIFGYETYKLILKQDPQKYYGLPSTNNIQLIAVATDKDQAGLLYQEASGHFRNCFAQDTEVITSEGVKAIGSLVGTSPTLLTGNGSWVSAPVRSFGKQLLYKLTLRRQGVEKVIYTTANHRWFATDQRKKYRDKGFVEFKTTELRPGKHRLQYVFGRSYKSKTHPSPFGVAHGFTVGDGTAGKGQRHSNSAMMIGEKDANLRPYFALCPLRACPTINGIEASGLPNYFRDLPSITENHTYLLGWLMGYFAADGTVSNGNVRLDSANIRNIEFARDVCTILGIGYYSIQTQVRPNPWAKGGIQTLYSLALMRSTLDDSFFLIPEHRASFSDHGGEDVGKKHWNVVGVEPTSRTEEVFCATVDGHGTFALEGNIVTGNCGFFSQYMANNTQSYARFQTPRDQEKYGKYTDDPSAKATIKVTFRSCVAKGLRGAGNIVIVMDEVAHFTDDGQSSADAVYDAVAPSAAAYSEKDPADKTVAIGEVEARIILISSPLGKQGLFYKLFQQGMSGSKASQDMLCIQAPTWEVNPSVEASFLESQYQRDPAVFDVEFGGEFSDRSKGWLDRPDDLLACVNKDARPQVRGIPRVPHFLGVDLGLVGDGTAVAVGHMNDQGRIVLDLIDQMKAGEGKWAGKDRLEFDEVADWIYDISKRFYISEGIFDQWAGIPFEQALLKRGLGQMKAEQMTPILTSQMFQNFKDMMWDKRIELYDHKDPITGDDHCSYIRELCELQAEYKSKYVTIVEAPKIAGKHDDQSDALVRMVWLASNRLGKMNYFAKNTVTGVGPNGLPPLNPVSLRRKLLQSGSHEQRMIPRGAAPGWTRRRGR